VDDREDNTGRGAVDDRGEPNLSESGAISLIVRIDLGPHGRLGPGKILLLQNIARLGSISAAARDMNMSYRQAWDLVDQLNRAFVEPVVASQTGGKSGGGALVTPFGHALMAHYRGIVAAAEQAAASDVAALTAKLQAAPADGI
jgi:molybdate transport system regulatory protein